jgi:hypothetical protein
LAAGENVVATARKPDQLQDLVERYPGRARAVRLDVTDRAQAAAAVQATTDAFGRLGGQRPQEVRNVSGIAPLETEGGTDDPEIALVNDADAVGPPPLARHAPVVNTRDTEASPASIKPTGIAMRHDNTREASPTARTHQRDQAHAC